MAASSLSLASSSSSAACAASKSAASVTPTREASARRARSDVGGGDVPALSHPHEVLGGAEEGPPEGRDHRDRRERGDVEEHGEGDAAEVRDERAEDEVRLAPKPPADAEVGAQIQLAASNATRAANANALSTEPIITGPSSEPMVRDRLGEEGAARGEVDARIQRAGGLTRWKFPPRCHTTLIRLTFRLTF